jgi:hypothetical protein
MSENIETPAAPQDFLGDAEKRISEIFMAQKDEVEQGLVAKINREKEEAQRRIEAVNQEFAKVRGVLNGHKMAMSELRETELHLRGEIRGHFERAVNYQKMMENAATLAGDELEKIGGLNEELEKVRTRAEEEYATLKKHLVSYAGLMATIPAPAPASEDAVNWNDELDKLRRVRDLLATLRPTDPSLPAAADNGAEGAAEATAPPSPEAEELAASLGLIDEEDDGVHDDHEFAVQGRPEAAFSCAAPAAGPAFEAAPEPSAEPIPGPAAGPEDDVAAELGPEIELDATAGPDAAPEPEPAPAAEDSPERRSALDGLARYRKSEPINNGIEIGFYAADAAAVLDAESFMTAVGKIVDGAGQLHAQLSQAASVKDLFLLKQEILNQQEVLRKAFFRVVRFCEKEGGRLPETLSEIVSSQGMKDIIERLTMANWSDPSDFKPFLNELGAMKRAFETRAASNPGYLRSVLDQVEGREN